MGTDGLPIQIFLFPIIAIVAVAAFYFMRKRTLAGHDQQFSNYRAGELAQRLALTLVEGDPSFNLFIRQANVDVQRGPADGRPVHIHIRMQGQPQGVPLELIYLYRVERESSLTVVTWRTWNECRMSAYARTAFPPFEVASHQAPLGPITRQQPLPAMPTGNPMVDSTYHVATHEPAMAQLLGQVLPGFTTFANSGVHLVGDGQRVSFVMQHHGAPLLANALYYAEQMSALLSDLARRVGGA